MGKNIFLSSLDELKIESGKTFLQLLGIFRRKKNESSLEISTARVEKGEERKQSYTRNRKKQMFVAKI